MSRRFLDPSFQDLANVLLVIHYARIVHREKYFRDEYELTYITILELDFKDSKNSRIFQLVDYTTIFRTKN